MITIQKMEKLGRKCGFIPYNELTQEQNKSLGDFLANYKFGKITPEPYWWKESEDHSWMCFNTNTEVLR